MTYLTLGIGVNLNQSPIADTSTCLREIIASNVPIDVNEFVNKLATNVVEKFNEADRNGFEGNLRGRISLLLEYKGEQVKIFDDTLTKVLN